MEFVREILSNPGIVAALIIVLLLFVGGFQLGWFGAAGISLRTPENMDRYPGGLTRGAKQLVVSDLRRDPLMTEHMNASAFEQMSPYRPSEFENMNEAPDLLQMLY